MTDPLLNAWRETSRFKNLLNPVRDPSAAWGVDVAEHLVEYAQSIGLHLSPDADAELMRTAKAAIPSTQSSPPTTSPSSPESVDFAQAALILQGSTSIYSRKIESLYTLAFDTVSTINQLSTGQDTNARNAKGRNVRADDDGNGNGNGNDNDDDRDSDEMFNPDEIQFLSLDDDDDVEAQQELRRRQLTQQTITDGENASSRGRGQRQGGITDDDDEDDEDVTRLRPVPHMLMQNVSLSDGNMDRANFKLRSAFTHPSGVFLTDGCPLVDENLNMEPTRLTPSRLLDGIQRSPSERDTDNEVPDIQPPMNIGDDDPDNDENDHFQGFDDTPPIISQTMESSAEALRNDGDYEGGEVELVVDIDPNPVAPEPEPEPEPEPDLVDPFEMYDPHEDMQKMVRPLRVGPQRRLRNRVRRRASALYVPGPERKGKDDNKRKRKGEVSESSVVIDVCAMIDAAIGRIPRNASLVSYVCVAAARDTVQALIRRRRKRMREREEFGVMVADDGSDLILPGGRSDGQRGGAYGDEDKLIGINHARSSGTHHNTEDEFSFPDDDDHDHMGPDSEFDVQVTRGAGDGAHDGVEEPLLLNMGDGNLGVGGDGDNTLSGLDHDHDGFLDDALFGGEGRGCRGESNRNGSSIAELASSYTETCAKYLAETAWMWEKRVVDCRLAERVEEWTARIQPVLEREEERDEFDIRKSGQAIIDRLKALRLNNVGSNGGKGAGGKMSEVLSSEHKFEVCRSFLASLQLANQGNVYIERDPNEEGRVCNPSLTLTTGVRGGDDDETTGDEQNEQPVFVTPSGAAGGAKGKRTKRKRPQSPTSSDAVTRPSVRSRMDSSESL